MLQQMIALFLDTETTGLNPAEYVLAEVCAILAHVPDEGPYRVLRSYSTLVQVGDAPMDADVRRLTGLTPELCNEHGVPLAAAIETLRRMERLAEVTVAWNAPFDRGFLDAAGFSAKAWVDAQRNVDWQASRESLVVVAAEVGRMVNPMPHAALGDVVTMLALTAPRLEDAVADSKVPRVWLSVMHSPRGTNDALKSAGFQWRSERRVWEFEFRDEGDNTEPHIPAGCMVWRTPAPLDVVPVVSVVVDCDKSRNDAVAAWLPTRWDGARRVRVADSVRKDYAAHAAEELRMVGVRVTINGEPECACDSNPGGVCAWCGRDWTAGAGPH